MNRQCTAIGRIPNTTVGRHDKSSQRYTATTYEANDIDTRWPRHLS